MVKNWWWLEVVKGSGQRGFARVRCWVAVWGFGLGLASGEVVAAVGWG